MARRSTLPLLLLGLLALGTAWVVERFSSTPAKPAEAPSPPVSSLTVKLTSRSISPDQVAPKTAAKAASSDSPKKEAGTESWMMRMEHALQEYGQGLELTEAESAELKRVFVFHQQVRLRYEADIARVVSTAETVTITIPPYPAAGAQLQERFLTAIEKTLGPDRTNTLIFRMMPKLEYLFEGFGLDQQEIVVSYLLEVSLQDGWARERHYNITQTRTPPAPRPYLSDRYQGLYPGSARSTISRATVLFDGGELMYFATVIKPLNIPAPNRRFTPPENSNPP